MVERRGTVFIAPVARFLPDGRMVDPEVSSFYVSWQDYDDESERAELVEDGGEVVGADAAIAWGLARCDRVLIRLGHVDQTHFSAGRIPIAEEASGRTFPSWPPSGPPSEGWWTPSDEAAAEKDLMKASGLLDRRWLGVVEPEVRDYPPGPWTRRTPPDQGPSRG